MEEELLRLLKELIPLKRSLAGAMEYRKLRFTQDDILGFFDEKLIYVWRKYQHLPYEELKAISITSLHNLRNKLYRIYGKEVSLEKEVEVVEEVEVDYSSELTQGILSRLAGWESIIVQVLLFPPPYITSKVNDLSKRIPSKLVLEYLGMGTSLPEIKKMNAKRRDLLVRLKEVAPEIEASIALCT